MVVFCSTVNSTDSYVIEVSTVRRFQNRVCSPSRDKEKIYRNKYIYIYIYIYIYSMYLSTVHKIAKNTIAERLYQ